MAPSDFHILGPQMRHLGGHKFQNVAKVQEAVLHEAQNSMLKVVVKHCDKCLNLHDDYAEIYAIVLLSHEDSYLK